jgi:hypothetical protein
MHEAILNCSSWYVFRAWLYIPFGGMFIPRNVETRGHMPSKIMNYLLYLRYCVELDLVSAGIIVLGNYSPSFESNALN